MRVCAQLFPLLQTNALYFEPFQEWAREFPNVKILSDGTRTNEVRWCGLQVTLSEAVVVGLLHLIHRQHACKYKCI